MAEQQGDAWAALGDPTRRGILASLVERPQSVAEIAAGLPISRPAVSQHLRVLEKAHLVVVTPDGRRRVYRASPDGLAALRAELDGFWARAMGNLQHIIENERKVSDDQSDECDRR